MDLLIQIVAVSLCILLAAVKSLQYAPTAMSNFELERQAARGDDRAAAEHERRQLLPAFLALRHIKEVLVSVLIAAVILLAYPSAFGVLLVGVYFLAAYIAASRGWLEPIARRWQTAIEPKLKPHVAKIAPFIGVIGPKKHHDASNVHIHSREELQYLIQNDHHVLSEPEKAALLAAFDFGHQTIADVMVPAGAIATIDIGETVGPVLLDRLHKVGHDVFIVVSEDLNDVRGLLYMRDLMPLDPDLQTVADAVRPTVHYLRQSAQLGDVLAASLLTGRQLFLAVDDGGQVSGLITLGDALAKMTGEQLQDNVELATSPERLA